MLALGNNPVNTGFFANYTINVTFQDLFFTRKRDDQMLIANHNLSCFDFPIFFKREELCCRAFTSLYSFYEKPEKPTPMIDYFVNFEIILL